MDLVSLLITIIGIMVLLGLYVMSRVFDQSPAKQSNKSIHIPIYTDTDGNKLSSIKADIPAQNYVPATNYQDDYQGHNKGDYTNTLTRDAENSASDVNLKSDNSHSDTTSAKSPARPTPHRSSNQPSKPSQYVLFIASPTERQLDGNSIIAAMGELGLHLGDKDIYHYCIPVNDDPDTGTQKLFSVANGVSPWTLKEIDLAGKSTPGLSLIMPLPSPIAIKDAITAFVDISEKLAIAIEGELQNTQQQMFLPTDKELMLKSAGC